ncbi:uncharacterized protein LOC126298090 [Schistocerca gregaria]|uniref:uncharacterized protein LOC126298090 n=1 Tax=Schistocerca gregaria TaxID=7010 RepID=UPI00211E2128|nr:uncharacterized protein LOC126298090 [Schistocerca gregaria]
MVRRGGRSARPAKLHGSATAATPEFSQGAGRGQSRALAPRGHKLEASQIPPPQPTTPAGAPAIVAVQSPAPDGRLSPPPRAHLRPPPPRSSTVLEPMDAEAAVSQSPPWPTEVVAPPPHPSTPSGGARPGRVSRDRFPRPFASNSGSRVESSAGSRDTYFASLAAPNLLFLDPPALTSDFGTRSISALLGFLPLVVLQQSWRLHGFHRLSPHLHRQPLHRSRLPSSNSLLPVRSPALGGRLPPPPLHHLQPASPPTCSSTEPVLMDAEGAVTPLFPSPMEIVAPTPHPSIRSGGARPGHVFHGTFSSPPHEQFGVAYGQHDLSVPLSAPSAAPPWVLHLSPEPLLNDSASFQGGGMWYR